MKVMGIDTATRACSVAIIGKNDECNERDERDKRDEFMAEYTLKDKRTHSEKLLPLIDKALIDSGLKLEELDGISVVIGPGSFTGLRISLATAQGLCAGRELSLTGVSSLDVLAYGRASKGLICPLMDARKNEVYTSLYKGRADGIDRLWDYRVISLDELFHDLSLHKNETEAGDKVGSGIIFTGDGVGAYREELSKNTPFEPAYTFRELEVNRASIAARLGLENFLKGKIFSPYELTPMYIRKSEAEKKMKERKDGQIGG